MFNILNDVIKHYLHFKFSVFIPTKNPAKKAGLNIVKAIPKISPACEKCISQFL